ncbi:hypothetical protein [Streptomyces lasiicapitis]|uniref:Glycosyltransferase n=1 Tax=Streptomyces lasiicapitis TaxID=1923961 RepID=A0ABQ2LLM6_9ACTN|nr:hypothetical protein [Streptomyces lasiicapitis]GGO39030.1 hypothetical protein GCM10012286_14870 [Streptomyces lasiicapitis]
MNSPAAAPEHHAQGTDTPEIRLSTVVMAHPRRADAARALCARHPELDARLITDPDPDGPPSALRTARLAWQSVAPGATHHLVLQDDAILAPDFAARVRDLIAARPAASLSLFTEWGSRTANAVRVAALRGHAWAPVVDDYLPSVALVLPAELALGFEEYATAKTAQEDTDDVALLGYLAAAGTETVVPVAGLVDHANPASLVGNDVMGPRSAACFPTTAPALPQGPQELVRLDTVPYFCWWEQLAVAYVRDASAPDGWRRVPAEDALLERGIPRARVVEALREALDRLPHRGFVHDRVSDVLLTEIWTTAYALGVVTHESGGAPDFAAPLAPAALATLAPGALRRVVPAGWLAGVGELLAPLVADGVARGAEASAGTDANTGSGTEAGA